MQWLNKQNPSNYKGAELDLILIWNTAGQELVTPSYLVRYFTAPFPSLLSCPLRVLSYKGLLHIRRDVFENSCGSRRSFLNLLMINCCHLSRFFLKDEKIWSLNQVNLPDVSRAHLNFKLRLPQQLEVAFWVMQTLDLTRKKNAHPLLTMASSSQDVSVSLHKYGLPCLPWLYRQAATTTWKHIPRRWSTTTTMKQKSQVCLTLWWKNATQMNSREETSEGAWGEYLWNNRDWRRWCRKRKAEEDRRKALRIRHACELRS